MSKNAKCCCSAHLLELTGVDIPSHTMGPRNQPRQKLAGTWLRGVILQPYVIVFEVIVLKNTIRIIKIHVQFVLLAIVFKNTILIFMFALQFRPH